MPVPTTALYAALLALLLIALAVRVSYLRQRLHLGLGYGTDTTLQRAIRVHGNAVEYIPLLMILMGLYELNGGAAWLLHLTGSVILIARVMHAWGLNQNVSGQALRMAGTITTWITLIILALANIGLVL